MFLLFCRGFKKQGYQCTGRTFTLFTVCPQNEYRKEALGLYRRGFQDQGL